MLDLKSPSDLGLEIVEISFASQPRGDVKPSRGEAMH